METENTLRLLTLGEKLLAQTVFGRAIQWNRVWVHCESYLSFLLKKIWCGWSEKRNWASSWFSGGIK